jgi:DNA-binding HxlR family transcriptional regulator
MHHRELRRTTARAILQKMLTQTLRSMEREGLLTRTVIASAAIRSTLSG